MEEIFLLIMQKNNIEHDICGKLVVANNFNELKTLKQLKINGEKMA